MEEVEDATEGGPHSGGSGDPDVPDVPDVPVTAAPAAQAGSAGKVECPQCLKKISEHCFKYSHRCKARPPAECAAPPVPPQKKVTYDKAALKALARKEPPMKNKKIIERMDAVAATQAGLAAMPPFVPFMAQRQQQAMLRQQAMLAPYQQMFTQCR